MRQPHLRSRGPFLPPLDQVVQYEFAPGYVVFPLPCPKRLRTLANGETLADSVNALILFESDHTPVYYYPVADIRMDLFEQSDRATRCPYKGVATHYSLKNAGGRYDDILWRYQSPAPGSPDLSGYASFYWHEVDHWFEEDEEAFVHARDPFRRVDCLASRRVVTAQWRGETIARSDRAVFLFETGLPTRHYLPREDFNPALLRPSDARTACPYKGEARYFHLTVGGETLENAIWYYPDPTAEAAKIRGLLSFAAETLDQVAVDGAAVATPPTPHSQGYNYHGYKQF